jgi:hypothetical protein
LHTPFRSGGEGKSPKLITFLSNTESRQAVEKINFSNKTLLPIGKTAAAATQFSKEREAKLKKHATSEKIMNLRNGKVVEN